MFDDNTLVFVRMSKHLAYHSFVDGALRGYKKAGTRDNGENLFSGQLGEFSTLSSNLQYQQ